MIQIQYIHHVQFKYHGVKTGVLQNGKVIFTPVLLTNSEQVISDRKIVSSSELVCHEMEVRVGRDRGR